MSDDQTSPPADQTPGPGAGHAPTVSARIAQLETRLARLEAHAERTTRSRDRWRAAALDFAARLDHPANPDQETPA